MEIIFHIFGNIYNRIPTWTRVSNCVEGIPVTYILCSDKFKNLTMSLYPKDFQKAFSFCPISCDSDFYYSKNTKLKKQVGIKDSDKVILYTGRISPSKNIDGIINICERLREIRKDFVLLLVGRFDDHNHYDNLPSGSYQAFITALIKEVNSSDNFIKYIPYQENIKPLYDISDIFISLSTMDGEDYGMSVCEALSSGLYTFLTDWGGYSSYKYYDGVEFFKVNQNRGQIEFDESKIVKSLDERLSRLDHLSREKRSRKNIDSIKERSLKHNFKFLEQQPILKKKAKFKQISFSSRSLKSGNIESYYKHLGDLF